MLQSEKCDRKAGHALCVRERLLRAAVGAACVGLVGFFGSVAWAGDDDSYDASDQSAMSRFLQTIGLRPSAVSSDIRYTERPPLVVPPSRDLPAPETTGSVPASNWPTEPTAKHQKSPKPKVATVPPATPLPANPNPPTVKKTWYNPASWFNKEEYATFTGEPVRENLTDPPTGYRTPSPDQPYGIGPEKKGERKASAADSNLTPAGGH